MTCGASPAHLDHVAGAGGLGVDAVWLAPFYPHGGVDGGYDVTDHTAVSPEFGSLADVTDLIDACHRAGIRVLVDLVVGHVSDRHPWFVAARSSRTDPRRDWFVWADGRADGGPPTNWVAEFGGPAWTRDPATGQWYHHSFYPEQPDLNWRNPAVRAAMAEVMRFWLDRGVDGLRLDAVQYLLKDPQLRDNPPAVRVRPPWPPEPGGLRRRWSRDQRGVARILRELRQVSDDYPGTILVGELYAPAERLATALGRSRTRRRPPRARPPAREVPVGGGRLPPRDRVRGAPPAPAAGPDLGLLQPRPVAPRDAVGTGTCPPGGPHPAHPARGRVPVPGGGAGNGGRGARGAVVHERHRGPRSGAGADGLAGRRAPARR